MINEVSMSCQTDQFLVMCQVTRKSGFRVQPDDFKPNRIMNWMQFEGWGGDLK